ncbi:MAG: hypothetical protein RR546_05775 [Erysipelotrichaceae bacterium]
MIEYVKAILPEISRINNFIGFQAILLKKTQEEKGKYALILEDKIEMSINQLTTLSLYYSGLANSLITIVSQYEKLDESLCLQIEQFNINFATLNNTYKINYDK